MSLQLTKFIYTAFITIKRINVPKKRWREQL